MKIHKIIKKYNVWSVLVLTQLQVEKDEEKAVEVQKEKEKEVAIEVSNFAYYNIKMNSDLDILIKNYISNKYEIFSNYEPKTDNYDTKIIDLLKKENIFISSYWFYCINQKIVCAIRNDQLYLIDGFILNNSNKEYLIISSEEFSVIYQDILEDGKENNIQYTTKYGKIINNDQLEREFLVRLILCGIYNVSLLKEFYNIFSKSNIYDNLIRNLVPLLNFLYNNRIPFSYLLEKFGHDITLNDLDKYQEFKYMNVNKKNEFINIVNGKKEFTQKKMYGGSLNNKCLKYLMIKKQYFEFKKIYKYLK